MNTPVAKIISGGQTSADRGGLDAAIELGIPHGGWCPKGRKAEDGVIPACYRLVETNSAGHVARTEQNVIDSHCTVVFTFGRPTGGSKKTIDLAAEHQRLCLCLDLAALSDEEAALAVRQWLSPGGVLMPGVPVSPRRRSGGCSRSVCPITWSARNGCG
jgi:hypothetical protein